MPNPLTIVPVALDLKSASGTGAAIDLLADGCSARVCVALTVEILAVSGQRPVISIDTSPDSITWREIGRFSQTIGRNAEQILLGCDRYLRANWTLVSGATAQLSVSGQAHQLYAEVADLGLALPSKVVGSLSSIDLAASTLAANVEAEGYFNGGYTLPLVSWDRDVRKYVANLLAFDAMKQRGFQPGGVDELIVKGRDDAISWLTKVSLRRLNPPGITDSKPQQFEGGCGVASRPRRGW